MYFQVLIFSSNLGFNELCDAVKTGGGGVGGKPDDLQLRLTCHWSSACLGVTLIQQLHPNSLLPRIPAPNDVMGTSEHSYPGYFGFLLWIVRGSRDSSSVLIYSV